MVLDTLMCMSFTQNTNLVQVFDTFLVTYFDVRAFILPHSPSFSYEKKLVRELMTHGPSVWHIPCDIFWCSRFHSSTFCNANRLVSRSWPVLRLYPVKC